MTELEAIDVLTSLSRERDTTWGVSARADTLIRLIDSGIRVESMSGGLGDMWRACATVAESINRDAHGVTEPSRLLARARRLVADRFPRW